MNTAEAILHQFYLILIIVPSTSAVETETASLAII
jgi:hypothetical protein